MKTETENTKSQELTEALARVAELEGQLKRANRLARPESYQCAYREMMRYRDEESARADKFEARVKELEAKQQPRPMSEAKRDGRCIIVTIGCEPEVVAWVTSGGMAASGWYRQSDSDPIFPDDDEWWELPGEQPTHRAPDQRGDALAMARARDAGWTSDDINCAKTTQHGVFSDKTKWEAIVEVFPDTFPNPDRALVQRGEWKS